MQASSALNPKILSEHLQSTIDTCTQLLALLNEESQVIKQRNLQRLESLTEQKKPLLIALDQSASERQLWRQQARDEGLDWLDLLQQAGGNFLLENWQTLTDLFGECQYRNQLNGRMIARSRQSAHRLLDIVRGLHEAPQLYTAGGRTRAQTTTRPFVKA